MNRLATLWEEFEQLPKPVTQEQLFAKAKEWCIQEGQDFKQFEDWLSTEYRTVLERLNA
jgi:hypothetical protein